LKKSRKPGKETASSARWRLFSLPKTSEKPDFQGSKFTFALIDNALTYFHISLILKALHPCMRSEPARENTTFRGAGGGDGAFSEFAPRQEINPVEVRLTAIMRRQSVNDCK
jgi:hypothetical protein